MNAGQLGVLSYNVQCWGSSHEGATAITLDAILRAQCAVLCLQETNAEWERALSVLEEEYTHKVSVDPGASGGNVIMSRFPFEEQHVLRVEQEVQDAWFPALAVAIRVNGVRVWVVSVHLHPPYYENDQPGLFAMRASAHIRKREIVYITEWIAARRQEGDGLIIGGDFNESDYYDSQVYLRHERGMRDALEMHAGHTHWWPLKRLWGDRHVVLRSRLDHVWYDPNSASCTRVQVMEGYEGNSSDHLPVVAEFVIGTPHAAPWTMATSWTTHSVGTVRIPPDSCWNFGN